MRALLSFLLVILSGCNTSPYYANRVEEIRAELPYQSTITGDSMVPVFMVGSVQLVERFPYDNLKSGMDVAFWPEGYDMPIAHRLGHRIIPDSWSTYGVHNDRDDTYRWTLTRKNYIGIVR